MHDYPPLINDMKKKLIQSDQISHIGDRETTLMLRVALLYFIYMLEKEKKCNTGRKLEVEK